MTALNLCDASFASFLSKPVSVFGTDLSNASTIEVLEAYEHFKRKANPKYSLSSEKYNIKRIQQQFGVTLKPIQINDEFWMHFIMFLEMKDLKGSTIKNYCGAIVTALKWGSRFNLTLSPTFDSYDKTMCKYERTKVVLTADDVSWIAHFDIDTLKKKPQWKRVAKRVRDQFVLQCNLSQRYSDIRRIEPSCFSDDKNTYTCVQQKTGNKATVNIKKFGYDKNVVRDILERYNYHAPYNHDISNFNKHLHELLSLIGGRFNEIVRTENKVRGKLVIEEMPKWKAIASHTGRRSFVSKNVKEGHIEAEIRRCTGHKDSKSFVKYIVYNEEDN